MFESRLHSGGRTRVVSHFEFLTEIFSRPGSDSETESVDREKNFSAKSVDEMPEGNACRYSRSHAGQTSSGLQRPTGTKCHLK